MNIKFTSIDSGMRSAARLVGSAAVLATCCTGCAQNQRTPSPSAQVLLPNTDEYLVAADNFQVTPDEARIIALDLATERDHVETVSETPEYIENSQYMFYMYPIHAGFNQGILVDGMNGRTNYRITMHVNMADK